MPRKAQEHANFFSNDTFNYYRKADRMQERQYPDQNQHGTPTSTIDIEYLF